MQTAARGTMKVGALAKRAGVSVRTLHHYDAIGLLAPSCTTATGHRLYDRRAFVRLDQVRFLCKLGFSLEEVGSILSKHSPSAQGLVGRRLLAVRAQTDALREQLERLEVLHTQLEGAAGQSSASDLLDRFRLFEKYFAPAQRQYLGQRSRELGEARLRRWRAEGADRTRALRDAMESGIDPASDRVANLRSAQRAHLREITLGDDNLESAFERLYQAEPEFRHSHGICDSLYEYLERTG